MVIKETLKEVRNEYKEFVRSHYPSVAENTVDTYVSDSFYLYNNDIEPSFWRCFENEESMNHAEMELISYYDKNIWGDKGNKLAKYYYGKLDLLKSFFDEEYGGVKNRIGDEYYAESILYDNCKKTMLGELSNEDAVKKMVEMVPHFSANSDKMLISTFMAMMDGRVYKRRSNTEITLYFANRIAADFGIDGLVKSLVSIRNNILYFYEQTGNKSDGLRNGCRKIAEHYGVDVDFSDSIFDEIIPKQNTDPALAEDNDKIQYWVYSAGAQSENWESDYTEGVMAVDWPDMGDLSLYNSKEEIRSKVQTISDSENGHTNDILSMWQFANDIKPGDVIFVKRGINKIIGRGYVLSEYTYDNTRKSYCSVRRVKWTDNGDWNSPVKLPVKTLTNITSFVNQVEMMSELFDEEIVDKPEYDEYTEHDFLTDVFMSKERYDKLKRLVLKKKNIILQGAPGVGKTFAAKRLAYSIIGEKDTKRVQMVQFHQSYSYEDFIMGYRPSIDGSGFELKEGVFYQFCKEAEEDERDHFFIIDEINRGNISKIFGELFVLIEMDKRNVKVQLLYNDEMFSVPPNVHIIGMMNTADRSLAMLDYALRRRFAFFNMLPAFNVDGFIKYQQGKANTKFDSLINTVKELNSFIDSDDNLGPGFEIGHSYFVEKAGIDDEWLSSVVEFELIPLLDEYWFDEPKKVEIWSKKLKDSINEE